jgi:hypothetical protein
MIAFSVTINQSMSGRGQSLPQFGLVADLDANFVGFIEDDFAGMRSQSMDLMV